MKAFSRPFFIVALLLCKLAQAAVIPPSPAPCSHASVDHASMAHDMTAHTSSELPHARCCKSGACPCLQMPALAASPTQLAHLMAVRSVIPMLATATPPVPAVRFFRPPI